MKCEWLPIAKWLFDIFQYLKEFEKNIQVVNNEVPLVLEMED